MSPVELTVGKGKEAENEEEKEEKEEENNNQRTRKRRKRGRCKEGERRGRGGNRGEGRPVSVMWGFRASRRRGVSIGGLSPHLSRKRDYDFFLTAIAGFMIYQSKPPHINHKLPKIFLNISSHLHTRIPHRALS